MGRKKRDRKRDEDPKLFPQLQRHKTRTKHIFYLFDMFNRWSRLNAFFSSPYYSSFLSLVKWRRRRKKKQSMSLTLEAQCLNKKKRRNLLFWLCLISFLFETYMYTLHFILLFFVFFRVTVLNKLLSKLNTFKIHY